MSRESSLWRWLAKARISLGLDLHMTRVENSVGSGMPDVEGCYKGVHFWIELKSVKRPIRKTTLICPKFQPAQIPWLKRRALTGGNVFVLLQVGGGSNRAIYLISGSANIAAAAKGMTEQELISNFGSHHTYFCTSSGVIKNIYARVTNSK